MLNGFNQSIASEALVEDQLIQWEHDTRGVFNNSFKKLVREVPIGHTLSKLNCFSGQQLKVIIFYAFLW